MSQLLHHENGQAFWAACVHPTDDCQTVGAAEEGRGSMVEGTGTTAEMLYRQASRTVLVFSHSKEGVRTASA